MGYVLSFRVFNIADGIYFFCVGDADKIKDLSHFLSLQSNKEIDVDAFAWRILHHDVYCYPMANKFRYRIYVSLFSKALSKKNRLINYGKVLDAALLLYPEIVAGYLKISAKEAQQIMEKSFWLDKADIDLEQAILRLYEPQKNENEASCDLKNRAES